MGFRCGWKVAVGWIRVVSSQYSVLSFVTSCLAAVDIASRAVATLRDLFVGWLTKLSGFQVLIDRPGHFKHIQLLRPKDRLQLVIGHDFPFVLGIL